MNNLEVGDKVLILSGSAYVGMTGVIEYIDMNIVLPIGVGEVHILADDGSHIMIPAIKNWLELKKL